MEAIVLYNMIVYAIFVTIYSNIDFKQHFETTVPVTPSFIMYFAFLTHSNAMCAEVVPRTDFGRHLLGTHVLCSWALFLILLAPLVPVRIQTPL
jgi:hypothetical protein